MRYSTLERESANGPTPLGFIFGLTVTLTLTLSLGLAITPIARAVDGVVEINHTCAIQTGCFPGDSPGYPVFIDGQAGRSYRLTSDLIVPSENTDGILLNASDIGIDLNNFAIIGVGCVGSTTNCTPTSTTRTGSGIERTSSLNRGTSVKNGSIIGMGRFGVFLGDQAHITNLNVRWNRLDGINTSSGAIVSGSTSYQNGRHGTNTFVGSTISGNTVSGNGANGIAIVGGSTVAGNAVYQNAQNGIFGGTGSVISSNAVYQNGNDGIAVGAASTVSGNAAYQNGDDGINVSSGCTVQHNTMMSNGQNGLNMFGDGSAAYRDNVITNNTSGTVSGIGVNMLGNSCNGTTTCP